MLLNVESCTWKTQAAGVLKPLSIFARLSHSGISFCKFSPKRVTLEENAPSSHLKSSSPASTDFSQSAKQFGAQSMLKFFYMQRFCCVEPASSTNDDRKKTQKYPRMPDFTAPQGTL